MLECNLQNGRQLSDLEDHSYGIVVCLFWKSKLKTAKSYRNWIYHPVPTWLKQKDRPSLHSRALAQALEETKRKRETGKFVVVVLFQNRVSLWSSSWPGVDQAILKYTKIWLPLLPECQEKFFLKECNILLWAATASVVPGSICEPQKTTRNSFRCNSN